jgi:hypothetical protein
MNLKEKAMSLILPKPVTTYLAAVEAKDTGMLSPCFEDGSQRQTEEIDE